jgi:RNA polymerase sigma factor (TIGR02999 family)
MNPEPGSAREQLDQLSATLYDALCVRARRVVRGGGVVDATDLVHEAYLRLARSERYRALPRAEFLALSATVVRRLLIDEVRRADRREPLERPTLVTMSEAGELSSDGALDLLALDAALSKLARLDPRQARIVELRFFAGMTVEEVAGLLDVPPRRVTAEWRLARAWLKRELGG